MTISKAHSFRQFSFPVIVYLVTLWNRLSYWSSVIF